MPTDRSYPRGGRDQIAQCEDRWKDWFDLSQKVVVYRTGRTVGSPSVVGYYTSVSAANTAAAAEVDDAGAYPRVEINWCHSDISHLSVDGVQHPDAREDLPDWIDADPAY